MPCCTPAEPTLVSCRNGVGSACVYGGGRTWIVPASSATSMRPSGRNFMLVGRLKPGREDLVLEEVRVGDVDRHGGRQWRCCRRRRGPARSACGRRWSPSRVSHGRAVRAPSVSSAPGGDAVDEELHAGDADVVGGVGGDGDDVADLALAGGRGDRDGRRRRVGRARPPSGVFMSVWISAAVSARL